MTDQRTVPSEERGIRWISDKTVEEKLSWVPLVDRMRDALTRYSAKEAYAPIRSTVELNGGFMGTMPSGCDAWGLGCKMVTVFPQNAAAGLPTHCSVMAVFDARTGLPRAMLSADALTARRTAAVSAAAARFLAPESPSALAILGAGTQARSHLSVLLEIFPSLQTVRLWSRSVASVRQLMEESASLASRVDLRASSSAAEAVAEADVVVVATGATSPVLHLADLSPSKRVLVLAVGAPRPTWREMDDALMREAALVVECRRAASVESGDVILSGALPVAEIGELFANGTAVVQAHRIVVFKSLGLGIEDLAAADLVLNEN